jgi:hypothetical protein
VLLSCLIDGCMEGWMDLGIVFRGTSLQGRDAECAYNLLYLTAIACMYQRDRSERKSLLLLLLFYTFHSAI